MKHPSHGVVALILTENPDGDCPEYDVKVEGKVVSCKIYGAPGLRWYIGCLFDQPGPEATTQCMYYIYESYLEGTLLDGPLEIDRRLQSNRTRLSPDRDSNIETYFFLPAKFNGKHMNSYFQPNNWLIELKIYQSDNLPKTDWSPPARSVTVGQKGTLSGFDKFGDHGTERLIIHYKWQYCCVDFALEILPGPRLERKKIPARHGSKTTKPCSKQTGVEKSLIPIPIGNTVPNFLGGCPESLPKYSWGPQPKNSPAWEQKGRDFARMGIRPARGRSSLDKRVSDGKGLVKLRQPIALQKARVYGDRPMLPIPPLRHPMKHLPVGWELRYTNTWRVYYVNHLDRYTTWQNPLEEDPSVPEGTRFDHSAEGRSDEGGQLEPTLVKLQRMDEMMALLLEERAHTEANIQRLRLGYTHPSEWSYMNIEHWFPEYEALEPVIEHIHAHTVDRNLLWNAFRARNSTIINTEALENARDELEESMSSDSPAEPTSEWDETNRGKKRSSEELEDKDSDNNEIRTGGEHGGQIDYREDYGPEVPVTRDGKIDPDWHRDKMTKFDRTKSSNFLEEYDEDALSWRMDQAPISAADNPPDYDMVIEDDELQEAIKQSLQQYDIDLERQVYKSSTNEPRYSTEESSQCDYVLRNYDRPPSRKTSRQWISERDDPNDYYMKINEEHEHSISSQMSKILIDGDPVDHGIEINPVNTGQPLTGVGYDIGFGDEMETRTLVDVTEPNNTNLDIQGDSRDNPSLRQVSQPSEIEEIGNDDELYAPPPWYWLVRFGPVCQSPPKPVLVLRGGYQTMNVQSVTATSGQVPSEQRVHTESNIAPSDIQDIQSIVPTISGASQSSTLTPGTLTKAPKGRPAELTTDGGPANEPDITTSASKSNKNKTRRRSSRINDTGESSSTSIIPAERTYNLRKRNPKL